VWCRFVALLRQSAEASCEVYILPSNAPRRCIELSFVRFLTR
jgi:hypothetical protein